MLRSHVPRRFLDVGGDGVEDGCGCGRGRQVQRQAELPVEVTAASVELVIDAIDADGGVAPHAATNTSGERLTLLLPSGDGTFIQRMTSPKDKVPTRSVMTCSEPVTEAQRGCGAERRSRAGVSRGRAGRGAAVAPDDRRREVPSGQSMVAAAGNHVVSLHRDRVGALELPSTLAPLRLESSSVQSITRC